MYDNSISRARFLEDLTPGERAGFRPTRLGAVHHVGKGRSEVVLEFVSMILGLIVTLTAIGLFLVVTGRADAARFGVEECVNTTAVAEGFTGSAAEKWSLFASGCSK